MISYEWTLRCDTPGCGSLIRGHARSSPNAEAADGGWAVGPCGDFCRRCRADRRSKLARILGRGR